MPRYLVVANQTLASEPLVEEVRKRAELGDCEVYVVVPATRLNDHLTSTEGEARALAKRRLAEAIERFGSFGAKVDGTVGDPRPLDAVGDVLRDQPPFDEILLSTLPPGPSRWLRQDLPAQVRRCTTVPVVHVVARS